MVEYEQFFTQEEQRNNGEIAEYFRNSLTRHIKNDLQRLTKGKFKAKELEDVSFSENGNTLELENLKITNPFVHSLQKLDVDFKSLTIVMQLSIENVNLEGDYFAFTENFLSLQMGHKGKLQLTLKNLTMNCNIGIYNRQDSFVPINYDVDYKIGCVETKLTSYSPLGEPREELNFDSFETNNIQCDSSTRSELCNNIVLRLIWLEVQAFLHAAIYKVTASNIVEFSYSELFLDEPERIRLYESQRVSRANAEFDNLLKQCIAGGYVAKTSEISKTSVRLKVKADTEVKEDFTLAVATCRLESLDTLRRISDATFQVIARETTIDNELNYCACVEVGHFTYTWEKFAITNGNQKFQGTLKLKPDAHKILVKFSRTLASNWHVSINLMQLGNLEITEKHLNEHDEHIFLALSESLMPFLRGHAIYQTSNTLHCLGANFNEKKIGNTHPLMPLV